MLIKELLILSIGFVQYLDLLANVFNALNKVVNPLGFELDVSRICLSSGKWYGDINGI